LFTSMESSSWTSLVLLMILNLQKGKKGKN
jgi:hypothetical protein